MLAQTIHTQHPIRVELGRGVDEMKSLRGRSVSSAYQIGVSAVPTLVPNFPLPPVRATLHCNCCSALYGQGLP
jgi:hypothetical protein